MNTDFDPARAAAWRHALIQHVAPSRSRRRMLVPAGLVVMGLLGGAGATTAAFAGTGVFGSWLYPAAPTGQPEPTYGAAVEAPAGVLPGAPIIALMGRTDTVEVSAESVVSLTDRPAAATHLRVTITGRTPGSLSFGTDPSDNNPSSSWTADDITAATASSSYDFPLSENQVTLYLAPSPGAEAVVSMQYVTYIPTRLGINADGHTYGVDGPSGAPDLVAVTGTDTAGKKVEGYVWREQLYAFSPDATAPANPDEALQMQAERDRDYPNGWDIPLYDNDGTTQIGVFHIG